MTRTDFKNLFRKEYSWLVNNNPDLLNLYLPSLQKTPRGYWNKKTLYEEARKYKSKREFGKKSSGAYTTALKKGWLNEITSHYTILRNYNITLDECMRSAKKI